MAATTQTWQVSPNADGVYEGNPKFELAPDAFLYARTLKRGDRFTFLRVADVMIVKLDSPGVLVYTEAGKEQNIFADGKWYGISSNYVFVVKGVKPGAQLVNTSMNDDKAAFVVFERLLDEQTPPSQSLLSLRSQEAKKILAKGRDFIFSFTGDGSVDPPIKRDSLELLAKPNELGSLIHVQLDLKPIPGFSFSETGPAHGASPPGRLTISRLADYNNAINLNTALNLVVLLKPRPKLLATSKWGDKLQSINKAHVEFFKNRSTEVTLNALLPAETIPFEIHATQDQVILVLSGQLEVMIDDWTAPQTFSAGEAAAIRAGARHRLANNNKFEKVTFISIYANI